MLVLGEQFAIALLEVFYYSFDRHRGLDRPLQAQLSAGRLSEILGKEF